MEKLHFIDTVLFLPGTFSHYRVENETNRNHGAGRVEIQNFLNYNLTLRSHSE